MLNKLIILKTFWQYNISDIFGLIRLWHILLVFGSSAIFTFWVNYKRSKSIKEFRNKWDEDVGEINKRRKLWEDKRHG
jgi:hypothetical protein